MKKIKSLMLAAVAFVSTIGFIACSDKDEIIVPTPTPTPEKSSNIERYQQEVDATVKAGKKHDKVILVVAFGSTWQQAYDAFDLTVQEYKNEFPSYDVFLSFSSAICINRAAAAENTTARQFYEPKYWLEAFGRVQYKEIIVQSMQVIPGEEFSRVVNAMKDFANDSNGDLDDEYMAKFAFDDDENPGENQLKLGLPLMYSGWPASVDYDNDPDLDVNKLAAVLNINFGSFANEGAMLFMGHGNPDTHDTYKANVRYSQLEKALQAINSNYFVGTVDMMENFKPHVYQRMQEAGITSGKVFCAPLMSIAGDHAHNDMAGEDLPKSVNKNSYTFAELQALANAEGEVKDCSWKKYFGAPGSGYEIEEATYSDTGARALVKGLLEYSNIRALYKAHTHAAEAQDFYHSRLPEEEEEE